MFLRFLCAIKSLLYLFIKPLENLTLSPPHQLDIRNIVQLSFVCVSCFETENIESSKKKLGHSVFWVIQRAKLNPATFLILYSHWKVHSSYLLSFSLMFREQQICLEIIYLSWFHLMISWQRSFFSLSSFLFANLKHIWLILIFFLSSFVDNIVWLYLP